jgi:hypothetical protein
MDLHIFKISREQFNRIPEVEQIFILQICTLLNEINILQKLALFSTNKKSEISEFENKAQNAQAFFVFTILAGKLWEGWQMVNKEFFSKGLRQEYFDALPDEGREALNFLGKYFSEQNIICKIRNQFAFHYGSEEIKKELKANTDENFELILSEFSGNCLFYFANTIVGSAIISEADQDTQVAMNKVIGDILKISKKLQIFLNNAMVVAMEKYKIDKNYTTFKLSDVPKLDAVQVPFFVSK